MYHKILFIGCLLYASCNFCMAQARRSTPRPAVEDLQIVQNGEQVRVWFRLRMDSVSLPANRSIRLVPFLTHSDSVCHLPAVTVAGKRQYIMQQRHDSSDRLIRRRNHSRQSFDYTATVTYQPWMDHATLYLTQDFCGCQGQSFAQAAIARQSFPRRETEPYKVHPVFAFQAPPVETLKNREESGQAFLDFPVNETVIYPDYRRNAGELDKIENTIEVILKDTNTLIRKISIHGFASPEGSYTHNRRLAQGRAEALKRYVSKRYQLADSLFEVTSTPEDWEGLKAYIRQSDITGKERLLSLLATGQAADAQEHQLRTVIGPTAYARLLKEVYPSLRHSDYTVSYTVKALQIEEAKRLLKKRPQLLSLNEMYQVASTYPLGSEPFNEVFDIAVRLFPDDPTANLNAALAALNERRYERAAQYLDKAGKSPEALHARGVLYLLTDRLEEAEPLLKAAAEEGIPEAADNLRELARRKESIHSK